MLQRILIAEDHPSNSLSLEKVVKDLGIDYEPQYYCDAAFAAIERAIRDDRPYDLLICDLSFEDDGRPQKIADGRALIKAARTIQPHLKILVFSVENKSRAIKPLFSDYGVDGYVMKGRRDIEDLREALDTIGRDRKYTSAKISQLLRQSEKYEFATLDIAIIKLLCEGVKQKDIPDRLKSMAIDKSSLGNVEKRLQRMKQALEIETNEQLIAYCKDIELV